MRVFYPVSQAAGISRRLEVHDQQDRLTEQAAALGPPEERADRDFRRQTIMTFRTLLLENALSAFMTVLLGTLQTKVSRSIYSVRCVSSMM